MAVRSGDQFEIALGHFEHQHQALDPQFRPAVLNLRCELLQDELQPAPVPEIALEGHFLADALRSRIGYPRRVRSFPSWGFSRFLDGLWCLLDGPKRASLLV